MPLRQDEVDPQRGFDSDELLYRRVSPDGINVNGEFLPSELNTISFNDGIDSAPSVLRSFFSKPEDVIAMECANGKEVSDWRVFALAVREIPSPLVAGDGKSFDFFPAHRPLPLCGAHSVIASCATKDLTRSYSAPPRSVRNALRAKLASLLKPVELTGRNVITSAAPS